MKINQLSWINILMRKKRKTEVIFMLTKIHSNTVTAIADLCPCLPTRIIYYAEPWAIIFWKVTLYKRELSWGCASFLIRIVYYRPKSSYIRSSSTCFLSISDSFSRSKFVTFTSLRHDSFLFHKLMAFKSNTIATSKSKLPQKDSHMHSWFVCTWSYQ